MSGECNLLVSVSPQHKFEATDVKALGASRSWTVHVIVLGQISFIKKIKENTSSKREGMLTRKMQREGETESMCVQERERDLALWLLFLYVFSSPRPALCKLG